MKNIFTTSALALSALTLTQCSTVNKITDVFAGGPPVTDQTDGATYGHTGPLRGNLNRVAAKVGDSIVTANELEFELAPVRKQLAAQFPGRRGAYHSEYRKARKQIFQELIDRELILNEFKESGAQVPPRELDREIQNRINRQYNGKRSLFLAELRKNGLSQAKHRVLVERSMVVAAMRSQHLTNAAPPTTSELRKEYSKFSDKLRDIAKDQVQYKKIWILKEPGILGATPETQLELAQDLAKDLRKGANFGEIAKEYSSDLYAEKGGQWPMTKRIELPVAFAPILFKEPIGKIIGPLEGPNGYHIFKVTRRINGPSPPLSKVRQVLEQRVNAEKSAARFNRWIERLRKKTTIVRYM